MIRARDGSLLDDDAMKILADMAAKSDYQVWIERVDSSGKVGFVIEDGHVKGQETLHNVSQGCDRYSWAKQRMGDPMAEAIIGPAVDALADRIKKDGLIAQTKDGMILHTPEGTEVISKKIKNYADDLKQPAPPTTQSDEELI